MTNESILTRIAAGDPGAVAACMDRYGGLVWSLVRARIRNAADAEDATQEIFIELWKNAARFDSSVASESVFIAMIARRRLIDRLRAMGRRPSMEELDEEMPLAERKDQDNFYADAVDATIAARAIAELDAAQREVIMMGVVEGLSHAEIAATTGRPLGTVKTHLRRGLLKVREMIESGRVAAITRGGK